MTQSKIMGFCLCLLMLASPFIYWQGLYDYANLPKSIFIQFSAFVSLIIFISKLIKHKSLSIRLLPIDIAVLIFLLWALLSLFWSADPFIGFVQWFNIFASALLFFFVSTIKPSKIWLKRFLYCLMVSLGIVCLVGCFQYYFNFDLIPQTIGPAAAFANKNMAGQYVAIILPLTVSLLFTCQSLTGKSILLAVILLSIFYLVLIGSRAAFLASSLSSSLVFILQIKTRKISLARQCHPKGLAIFFSLSILLFASAIYYLQGKSIDPVSRITEKLKHEIIISDQPVYGDTFQLRLDMWQNGIAMIRSKPVWGFGIGNFKSVYPLFHQAAVKDRLFSEHFRPGNIHNDMLQIVIELGFIGLILFLTIMILPVKMVRNIYLFTTDTDLEKELTLGFLAGLFSILILCLCSFPLERANPLCLFFTYLGTITCLYRHKNMDHRYSLQLTRKSILPTATFIGIILGAGLTSSLLFGVADHYYQIALLMEHQKQWHKVISAGKTGLTYHPKHADLQSALGLAQIQSKLYHEAIYTLNHLLKSNPYHLNALINLAIAYHKTDNPDQAILTFKKALAVRPDSLKILSNLSIIYRQQQNYPQAAFYAKQARGLSAP